MELAAAGAEVAAAFATKIAENDFAPLPLCDKHVLVWITRFRMTPHNAQRRKLPSAFATWSSVLELLGSRIGRLPMQQLRLHPTSRSQVR